MSAGGPSPTPAFAPMPQAPTALAPAGITAAGAASAAWQPNVLTWVATWRALITLDALVAILTGLTHGRAGVAVGAAAMWTVVSVLAALFPPRRRWTRRVLLWGDVGACVVLLVLAPDETTLALLAAYACSSVVSWAAGRPADAFIAAGVCTAAYALLATTHATGTEGTGFTGTVGLFFFFALATSGFFTVANRIGALEIATEISRERGRYRRDLHDRLGQALSGLHFELQAVRAVGLDEHSGERLLSLAGGYHDAQRMLRDLFRVGDEPMVGTNVASVIKQEARRMGQQAGVQVDVQTTGDASRVPPWMRPHVVAIAGESVNNAVKNGHAGSVEIAIDVTDDLVVLSVTDDGVGFDNPPGTITEKEGHYGLREMAERARICSGEVVIASEPGFGTRVRLQVPLPDDATQDILERDASKLRENVWTLLATLRLGLGAVAAIQLAVLAVRGGQGHVAAGVLAAAVVADLAAGLAWSRQAWRSMQRSSRLVVGYVAWTGALLAIALWGNSAAAVLLYAPLVLLAAGVARGRRPAARATWGFGAVVVGVAVAARLASALSDLELRGVLVHVTDVALVGMAAVQGAKLLDRLETLQIRVRFQALARLRRGLSGRMRDQLTERLEELEQLARELAGDATCDERTFAAATERLQEGSTELKRRLRDIVHTLADPTPSGRTPLHV